MAFGGGSFNDLVTAAALATQVRIISAANWATRQTDYTWADGDIAQNSTTGQFYKWRLSNDYGDLIRPEQYARALVWDCKIKGDVTPANETPALTDSVSGTGAWTSDGTDAIATSTGSTDHCGTNYTHGITGKPMHVQGYWAATTRNGATLTQRTITTRNGARAIWLGADASGNVSFSTTGGSSVGTVHATVSVATIKFIELFDDGTTAYAYADCSTTPFASCPLSALSANASLLCGCGDNTATSVASGNVNKYRQLSFWHAA